VPIGAGLPDIVVASCDPAMSAVARVEAPHAAILAYLRGVGRARAETIAARLAQPLRKVLRCLDLLTRSEAIMNSSGTYSLATAWRNPLPEIVSVEVKVADWQKAVSQAGRNCIFSHRSFVALPLPIAQRVRSEIVFRQTGVGLLAVDDDHEVALLRPSPRREPRVWTYYYELASLAACHFAEAQDELHRTHRRRPT